MKRTILMLSFMLAATLSFAQEIRKGTDKNGNLILEKNGKKIVDAIFEKIASFDSDAGLIPAKLSGKWGFYDNDGKLVIQHQYEGLVFQNVAALQGWYVQERMQVVLNGNKIFIDKTGSEGSAPAYDLVIETTHTGAGYFFKKDGKWALADKDKKVLTEFVYDKIVGPIGVNPFVYRGTRDGQDFRLNMKGEEEASIGSAGSNAGSAPKKEESGKCNYKCQKCDKITQGNCNASNTGITVENCFAQQPDPSKGKKNHEWRKQ